MRPVAQSFIIATTMWLFTAGWHVIAQTPAAPGQTPATPAQAPAPPMPSAAPTQKPEEGIPITDATVQKACAGCHRPDDKQQLSRISFQRNTPEGWQEIIRRMAALNGLQIDAPTARDVVKYLSNHHGLAPEEARAAAFEVERRLPDFKYTASADAEDTCNRCHSLGRVISQRRTRDEWNLLIAMHRGWYPLVDNQAFRRNGPPPREPGPDGRPPDTRQPVEKAIEHLAKAFPLITPEWTAWSATMRPARLEGTWALRATELGKGGAYGRMVVTPVAGSPDEFTTEITYIYGRSGERVVRTGRAQIYTGFQWRGRSTPTAAPSSKDVDPALREVMFVDRDWRTIEGRWFTGGYDEIGMDVRLERADAGTTVLGTDRTSLRAGTLGPTPENLRCQSARVTPARAD